MTIRNTEGSLHGNRPLGQRYSVCLNFSACDLYGIAVNPGPQPFRSVGAHPPVLHACNSLQRKPYWNVRKAEDDTYTAYPKCSLGLLKRIPR